MINQMKFGRRLSKDENDLKFMMTRKLGKPGLPLPTRKTWPIKAAALDQGNTGTCVAHAWCNFLRAAPIQTNKGIDELRWVIYDKAILLDEWTDNDLDVDRQMGTSVRAGADAVMGMNRLKSYLWAFSLRPAIEWVLTEGPVVLGTNWYSSMMDPNPKGFIEIKQDAYVVGGHAYLWRGVDTKTGMARISNSWGDEWGKSGEAFVSLRDMERLIHEDGECCTAIEQKLEAAKV